MTLTWDRALRVAIGLFVLSLLFWGPRSPFGLLGLVPLMSGLSGGCPVPMRPGRASCATPPVEPHD